MEALYYLEVRSNKSLDLIGYPLKQDLKVCISKTGGKKL